MRHVMDGCEMHLAVPVIWFVWSANHVRYFYICRIGSRWNEWSLLPCPHKRATAVPLVRGLVLRCRLSMTAGLGGYGRGSTLYAR